MISFLSARKGLTRITRLYPVAFGAGAILLWLFLVSFAPVAHASSPLFDSVNAQATVGPTAAPPTPSPVPPTPTPAPTPTPTAAVGSGSSGLPVVPIFLGVLFLGMVLAALVPVVRSRFRGR